MDRMNKAFLDELVKLGASTSTAGRIAEIVSDIGAKGKEGAGLAWKSMGPEGQRILGGAGGIAAVHQMMSPDSTAGESIRSGTYMAGGAAAGRAASKAMDIPKGRGRVAATLIPTIMAGRAAYRKNKESRLERKKKARKELLGESFGDILPS